MFLFTRHHIGILPRELMMMMMITVNFHPFLFLVRVKGMLEVFGALLSKLCL
jgi:hypothetical protein